MYHMYTFKSGIKLILPIDLQPVINWQEDGQPTIEIVEIEE